MGNQLQHEVKKKTPFNSLKAEALLNLLRTNDQFSNQFVRRFREFGLTSSQYNILRILRGEGKPLPSLEIASRMIQVVPAITGLIDRLEKAEMVTRQRCEEDRRVVYVAITKKALKLIDKIDAPLAEMHDKLIGHMTQTELKDLIRLLEKARAPLTNPLTE
ncbi:MAG: MarR family winged helix-turn-helix transcriptional regulator [Pirellulales bacterium]